MTMGRFDHADFSGGLPVTYPQIKPFGVTDEIGLVTDEIGRIGKTYFICHDFEPLLISILDTRPCLWITCRVKTADLAEQGQFRDR